jgi:hypothetical protein
MNKKLINEDIKNMKYLFGYKAGRVISEQDFDYTTDDYLDTEIDENGKPERLVKHKNTNKIVGSHKKGEGFRPSPHGEKLGFKHHPMDIPHGTKFGGTEVGDFDYEEMDEGYEYDDVDETNPDDVEDDTFGDFDLSKLNLDDEDFEDNNI